MKVMMHLVLTMIVLVGCDKNDDKVIFDSQESIPIVKENATFRVLNEKDIVYAEGLSHESWNSTDIKINQLKLDAYFPDNELENRPVYMFIHGGGFSGGSKQQEQILNLAQYYSSRGWVFFSIDYRLKRDYGTIPSEWFSYGENVPIEDVDQFYAIYPAQRDAKAALRWIVSNASTFNINPDYITVGGGSAGAITAITTGVSLEEDYRDELSLSQDPTLTSTNIGQSYQVKTIIDLWGSKVAIDALQLIFGHRRFDNTAPPLFIAHGTEDPTVPFSAAEDLKAIYDQYNIPLDYHPIEGAGHGAWNTTINNKRLEELAFDFIVQQQELIVE